MKSFFRSIFLLFVLTSQCYGQLIINTDSLQHVLSLKITDAQRIEISLTLSDQFLRSNPSLALEYSEESLQLARKLKVDSLLSRAYLNQGNAYLHLGNYSRSLQTFQYVIPAAEANADSSTLCIAYGNIGTIYYYQHDYENALKFDLQSLRHFSANMTDKKRLLKKASLLNNIGIIYDETKEYKEAETFYKDALALSRLTENDEMIANVLNNQGTLYRDLGNNDLALKFYKDALDIRIKNKNKFGEARSYHSLGVFYYNDLQQNALAESYLTKAIAIGDEIRSWQTVSSAADYLYKLYKRKKDHVNALNTLELYMQVSDSLFNEQSTRKIAQLEMQFEFDRKQSEALAVQKEKDLYFKVGSGGLFLLLIIVTLLFFLQRNKTRRSELEQAHLLLEKSNLKTDLLTKDKELATNIMYLLNKNELINTISEKLLTIKQNVNIESQGAVQKVILDLQSNLQPELWQEFEFRFQQVHEHFYKTLNERFPDLSPSDRRLCAFLKLDMTTKEISAITHQNAKSIDVARTRLRKKLNLTGTDQNLVNFLTQLGTIPI
jgi:tetratricopeptide (TPR) repeat protein